MMTQKPESVLRPSRRDVLKGALGGGALLTSGSMLSAKLATAVLALALVLPGCSSKTHEKSSAKQALTLSDSARAGQKVFTRAAQPTCGTCHVLKHARSTGVLGPNLDLLRPGSERTRKAVNDGIGLMPSQTEILTEEQIRAVSDYVYEVAGR